jgi:zinc protease
MKKISFLLFFICLPLFAKPVLNIQTWHTANGAKVLFVATKTLPMLDIKVAFHAGSSEDGKRFGVAQFTNAMLSEGTKTLTADQIATNFDKVGAQFGTNVGRDMANVSLRSLTKAKYLTPALKTFAAVLMEPAFKAKAFKRVQQQTLSTIKQQQQDPTSIASNNFYATIYGTSPYGHPVVGSAQTVQALQQKDLQNFYAKYYVARNAVISIVGDVSLKQAQAIATQITKNLPEGKAAKSISIEPSPQTAIKHIDFPAAQTTALIGQIGINWQDPDLFPLLVGNFILGQSPLTSKLFQEVRNKRGLAYSVSSGFTMLQNNGPFVIFLQTRTEQAKHAIQVSKDTLQNFIDKGPTTKELAAAKKSIVGRFPLKFASNSQISAILTTIGFYNLPDNYLDTYRNKISAVTTKQIQTAFTQQLNLQKMTVVTVGQTHS